MCGAAYDVAHPMVCLRMLVRACAQAGLNRDQMQELASTMRGAGMGARGTAAAAAPAARASTMKQRHAASQAAARPGYGEGHATRQRQARVKAPRVGRGQPRRGGGPTPYYRPSALLPHTSWGRCCGVHVSASVSEFVGRGRRGRLFHACSLASAFSRVWAVAVPVRKPAEAIAADLAEIEEAQRAQARSMQAPFATRHIPQSQKTVLQDAYLENIPKTRYVLYTAASCCVLACVAARVRCDGDVAGVAGGGGAPTVFTNVLVARLHHQTTNEARGFGA